MNCLDSHTVDQVLPPPSHLLASPILSCLAKYLPPLYCTALLLGAQEYALFTSPYFHENKPTVLIYNSARFDHCKLFRPCFIFWEDSLTLFLNVFRAPFHCIGSHELRFQIMGGILIPMYVSVVKMHSSATFQRHARSQRFNSKNTSISPRQ